MKLPHKIRMGRSALAFTIVGLGLGIVFATSTAEPPQAGAPPKAAAPAPPNAPNVPRPAVSASAPAVPKPPPPPVPPAVDPATGLPVPSWSWKDENWADPDHMVPEIRCDALPVRVFAEQLLREFKNEFDILIPSVWQDRLDPSVALDPGSATVRLELRNVRASEIFNAMNLMFDLENSPYRWELRLNGDRRTAILRVLPNSMPVIPRPPTPPVTRLVFFVGDLVKSGEAGGIRSMEVLVKTVTDIFQKGYGEPKSVIQFHKDAQLLIVNGTSDEIGFVQSILSALREKGRYDEVTALRSSEGKVKTEPKSPQ